MRDFMQARLSWEETRDDLQELRKSVELVAPELAKEVDNNLFLSGEAASRLDVRYLRHVITAEQYKNGFMLLDQVLAFVEQAVLGAIFEIQMPPNPNGGLAHLN